MIPSEKQIVVLMSSKKAVGQYQSPVKGDAVKVALLYCIVRAIRGPL